MDQSQDRLDQFTDGAFAFAVTLLVIGGAEPVMSSAALRDALLDIPAFAIGFAILAMFWLTQVRWRRMRGQGNWITTALVLGLVFLVLIYVQLLQAMSRSFAAYLGASSGGPEAPLGEIFAAYGGGFMAMSLVTASLFAETWRCVDVAPLDRRAAQGETIIWSLLFATGLFSTILSLFSATQSWAPVVYASLPLTVGLFAWRFDWEKVAVED